AANSIIKKFRKLYKSKFPKPRDVIKTSDSKLRTTGLSKMKIVCIKELSKKIESKELNMRKISTQSDEQVIEVLTDVKGIGRWTAEMFLIFSLGRLDILPVGDLGLKKGIQSMYSLKDLPEKEQIEQLTESWKPYRTVATWYLWKSLQKFDTIG
ncbi:MAG: DNA-3-methyladenine glycosylase family protein, partial [Nitrosopumilaceae archaeon]